MRIDETNSIMQLLEAMDLTAIQLEKAIEEKNSEKIRKAKQEMLNFHKEIKKILEKKQ